MYINLLLNLQDRFNVTSIITLLIFYPPTMHFCELKFQGQRFDAVLKFTQI